MAKDNKNSFKEVAFDVRNGDGVNPKREKGRQRKMTEHNKRVRHQQVFGLGHKVA